MTQSNPPAPASVPAAATESRSAAHGPTRKLTRAEQRAVDAKNRLSSPAASIIAIVIAIVWTIPTAGPRAVHWTSRHRTGGATWPPRTPSGSTRSH